MDVTREGGARVFGLEGASNGEQREKRSSKEPPVGESWSVQLMNTV